MFGLNFSVIVVLTNIQKLHDGSEHFLNLLIIRFITFSFIDQVKISLRSTAINHQGFI